MRYLSVVGISGLQAGEDVNKDEIIAMAKEAGFNCTNGETDMTKDEIIAMAKEAGFNCTNGELEVTLELNVSAHNAS